MPMLQPLRPMTAVEKHLLYFLPGRRHVVGENLTVGECSSRLQQLGLTKRESTRFAKNAIRIGSLEQGRCPFMCLRSSPPYVAVDDMKHMKRNGLVFCICA